MTGGATSPVKISYCDGPRLRRALLAAADYLSAHRAELDRINLFPVADGDTGTNLSLTMRSVAEAVRPMETGSVGEVARAAAEASVLGARGNSGMLVAHFLLGFSRSLGQRLRAGTREFADAVEARLTGLGEVVSFRAEDTRPEAPARRVAVVTDSSADLPRAWARQNGVEVVPLEVVIGDRSYWDGEEIGPDELLAVLRDPSRPLPTTSQPPPGAFAEAYGRCLDCGSEEVLGILLSGAVSGTLGSARTAARGVDGDRIRVVDSRSGSLGLGLGMLVLRAVELLDEGASRQEMAREIERIRARSGVFFTVEDLGGLLRSGRVGRAAGPGWRTCSACAPS